MGTNRHSMELLKMLTTEMESSAAASAKLQRELNSFFEMCPDILVIAKDGVFIKVNYATTQALGFSKEELTAQSFDNFVHPDDRNATSNETSLIISGLPCTNFQNRYRCKDGSYRWLEWHGVISDDVIYACARDITSQKDMQDRFEMAFHSAPIGMAMVGKDGTWLKINQVLCEIVGYSEQELVTKTFQDITHPDDLMKDLKELNRVINGEIKGYNMLKRYIKKDGSIVNVSLHVVGIQNAVDETQYFISHIVLK